MKNLFLTAALALSATAIFSSGASAQGRNCAPREVVVERLASKYGESRKAIGIGQQGMVMETFASDESGSWTITVTMPTGMTCLMASGQSFEALNEDLPETDEES